MSEVNDPKLELQGPDVVQHLSRIVHIGLLCVQESAADRPNMSEVMSMLSNETMILPTPKRTAFFTGRSALDTKSSESKSKDRSVNGLSITVLEAR